MAPGDSERAIIRGQDEWPSKTAEVVIEQILPEWVDLFLAKNAGYGDMHSDLGTRGQYVDLHRKTAKLRRVLWDGHPDDGFEQIREVAMDLIGHCFLLIETLDREEEEGQRGRNKRGMEL